VARKRDAAREKNCPNRCVLILRTWVLFSRSIENVT
jgi:hypothetical protein